MPAEKHYSDELLFYIEKCYKKTGLKVGCFAGFLSPSFDNHECAYACMSLTYAHSTEDRLLGMKECSGMKTGLLYAEKIEY